MPAKPLIRRTVQLSPALVQAHRNLVPVLEDQSRFSDAPADLDEAIQANGLKR